MARILIGVTGGIAAYRALELARLTTKSGHAVRVAMTPAATRFVGPASFEGIVGAPVLTDEFERDPMRGAFPGDSAPAHDPIGHLAVVESCDAFIIAPASANTIAKLAAGIADSMVTTSFLACTSPRLVAPAMNDRMYRDDATQANLETLRGRGITVIEPDEGALASRGEHGVGRLAQPEALLARVEATLPGPSGPWDGLHVLVTAGGTREPIDSVRYIGNRSSGRMGVALAEAALRRGAAVTIVAANVVLPIAAGVKRVDVETAAELARATEDAFETSDVLLMAAAVADFRPSGPTDGKIARAGSGGLELRLEETDDVLAGIARARREDQTLVGFAAEHGQDAIARARDKLQRKGVDAIVFNDVSRPEIGFDAERNEVTILEAAASTRSGSRDKAEIAEAILAPERVDALRLSYTGMVWPSREIPSGEHIPALPPGARTARGRQLFRGHGAAGRGRAERAREEFGARGAGPGLLPQPSFPEAVTEFEAVVATHPVNDYAQFCLGRALTLTGDLQRARHHLALAANLRPERRDYRIYRERGWPTARSWSGATMRALVQRVARASVAVDGEVAAIDAGLLVLLGVREGDDTKQADRLAEKIGKLRVFDDADGRMNEPLGEREVLCVSQFTLYADTRRGNRPSFTGRAAPDLAEALYERFCDRLGARRGIFGAQDGG